MKKNSHTFLALLISLAFNSQVFAEDFPQGPELSITPGKLCDRPTSTKYAEQIPYCARNVSYSTKEILMKEYDQKFDYNIMKMARIDFKIDHFIPLCVGGSNDITNLWPQHKSIYKITDPLEPILCAKMAQGRLKQKDAVLLVIDAKTNLERVPEILRYVNGL